jgi:hypothetical protein
VRFRVQTCVCVLESHVELLANLHDPHAHLHEVVLYILRGCMCVCVVKCPTQPACQWELSSVRVAAWVGGSKGKVGRKLVPMQWAWAG